jgi:hypothetical protein
MNHPRLYHSSHLYYIHILMIEAHHPLFPRTVSGDKKLQVLLIINHYSSINTYRYWKQIPGTKTTGHFKKSIQHPSVT